MLLSRIRIGICSNTDRGGKVMPCSDSPFCVCAWCKKLRNDNGLWVEFGLPAGEVEITHGICPDCDRSFRLEINRLYRKL